jgi:hypothetical protein
MVLGKFFCNCVFDEWDFNEAQLKEIKLGLLAGIEVNYALPTIDANKMKEMRESKLHKHKIKLSV